MSWCQHRLEFICRRPTYSVPYQASSVRYHSNGDCDRRPGCQRNHICYANAESHRRSGKQCGCFNAPLPSVALGLFDAPRYSALITLVRSFVPEGLFCSILFQDRDTDAALLQTNTWGRRVSNLNSSFTAVSHPTQRAQFPGTFQLLHKHIYNHRCSLLLHKLVSIRTNPFSNAV